MAVAASSSAPPPWVELPEDVTANILQRLGVIEILESAQLVCTTWRRVCLDPSMYRVIYIGSGTVDDAKLLTHLCHLAVDRSQGQLLRITFDGFADNKLLNYIADRSSHLKCLTLRKCNRITGKGLVKAAEKLPLLEELHLTIMPSVEALHIYYIGIYCPMLTSFTFNEFRFQRLGKPYVPDYVFGLNRSKCARAIAKSMPNLRHLSVICNTMNNKGLEAILDGCPHLETLDLRLCFHIDLFSLGKRYYEKIKHQKRPYDSISDIKWLDGYSVSREIAWFVTGL